MSVSCVFFYLISYVFILLLQERCLVDSVLQADTPTALLAADVWCFTARLVVQHFFVSHIKVRIMSCPAYIACNLRFCHTP